MKKLSLLLFFIFIVVYNTTSCTQSPAQISKSFSAEIISICNGEKLKSEITVNNNKYMSIEILSPSAMKGYCYTYKNDYLNIQYKSYKVKAQTSYLPGTAFPTIIYNVLSSLKKEQNCSLTGSDQAFAYYKGKCESGDYEIKAEFNSGAIREISIKSIKFTAKFSKIIIK